jgi:hypothetical protein
MLERLVAAGIVDGLGWRLDLTESLLLPSLVALVAAGEATVTWRGTQAFWKAAV